MKSSALFPFGINSKNDAVGADIVAVLTAAIHLDRRNARAVGWRGMRPCMCAGQAWTLRLAGADGVYGLAFLGEDRDDEAVYSRFAVFHFPDPDDPSLARRLPATRDFVALPEYFDAVREFSQREESEQFFLGLFGIEAAYDLSRLVFTMEAQARQRIVSMDGMPDQGVPPGGFACDAPSLRLAVPFMRLFSLSAASLLETDPAWSRLRRRHPLPAFTHEGEWGAVEGEHIPGLVLRAVFSAKNVAETTLNAQTPFDRNYGRVPAHGAGGSCFLPMTGRAFARKKTTGEDARPILHVVSGFLGSGKTTFVSEWLSWLHNHDRHTAVLQNELGEKGLDASLLAHETLSESLDEGCVCCTLADSLRPALRRLLNVLPTEQILLETTGLANPGAVGDALTDLDDMVKPGLLISLVDALDIAGKLAADPGAVFSGLAGEQIRKAKVLVLNKSDMVDPEQMTELVAALQRENPEAVLFQTSFGRIPFGELDRLSEQAARPGALAAAAFAPARAHVTHRDEGYASLLLAVTRPIGKAVLNKLVETARDRTPRIKGVIDSIEEKRPMIVQYAAGILRLEDPPSPPGPERFLTLIGTRQDEAFAQAVTALPGFALMPKRRLASE